MKISHLQQPSYAQASISSMANAPGILLQRRCACGQNRGSGGECESCRKRRIGTLQRSAVSASSINHVPPIVHEVLRSPGAPLDAQTRTFMEPRFEHDFSRVRVHSDARAAESAWTVNALAYTVGHDIVFGSGQFAPKRSEGQRLIAHELTHVLQQSNGIRLQPQSAMSEPQDAPEREADAVADKLVSHEDVSMPFINTTEVQASRKIDPFEKRRSPYELPEYIKSSTLPHREAVELVNCIRIMGDENEAFCRNKVLGVPFPMPVSEPSLQSVIPSSALSPMGKPAETAFMAKVYNEELKWAINHQDFTACVPKLEVVEDGKKLHKSAVPDAKALLVKARKDLKSQQAAGNAHAIKVKKIGIDNAYRGMGEEKDAWQKAFRTHYALTKKERSTLKGGEFGDAAVRLLVFGRKRIPGKKDIHGMIGTKAIPGFSNHSKGFAIDFMTIEKFDKRFERLGPNSSDEKLWKESWFWGWLVAHAATYNFKPLSSEAWHWDHLKPQLSTEDIICMWVSI
jgi:hypothetical protein